MLNDLIDRIRLPFRQEKELYSSLYRIIGVFPRDISYYQLALMHKSVMRRNAKGRPVNNERLEFLGDAILDAIVGDIVYRHFPGKREGFLTNTRSKLVQRDTLNRLAKDMGISKLILSSGRSSSHNNYMGGNAFEALVGALDLDRGYNACMRFMEDRVLAQMINIDKVAYKEVNFKSKLIEWSQKNRVKIAFEMTEQNDQSSSPVFNCRVKLEGCEGCEGAGYSKKESQQKAAKLTLERLRKEPQFIDSIFAAKAGRTKMEEEPVERVPAADRKDDFIISRQDDGEAAKEKHPTTFREQVYKDDSRRKRRSPMYRSDNEMAEEASAASPQAETPLPHAADPADTLDLDGDEFDLSHISAQRMSHEEIVAQAEAEAFEAEVKAKSEA